jgi:hypothetical protein
MDTPTSVPAQLVRDSSKLANIPQLQIRIVGQMGNQAVTPKDQVDSPLLAPKRIHST